MMEKMNTDICNRFVIRRKHILYFSFYLFILFYLISLREAFLTKIYNIYLKGF